MAQNGNCNWIQGSQRILKERRVFLHGINYFELDKMVRPSSVKGRCVLAVEVDDQLEDITTALPPWIRIIEEVTGKKEFYSYYIAHHSD